MDALELLSILKDGLLSTLVPLGAILVWKTWSIVQELSSQRRVLEKLVEELVDRDVQAVKDRLQGREHSIPTEDDRIKRLVLQSNANTRLTSTVAGRKILRDFYFSELQVSTFLQHAVDETLRAPTPEDLERSLDLLVKDESWWRKMWGVNGVKDSLKDAVKTLPGKLFDKANDLVKSFVGGSKS
jgi:hypothetical protein